ncbi:MAG: hypothetical protein CVT92_17110 [Bacteroidetes bacterium HGW-Bacteroidetes-1]|jgi:hypothetical protein|nr:MAG: hypothetical protein CVT92_17110 [Bacteroidetes bacterium HGW-Bacteroidetes-1]
MTEIKIQKKKSILPYVLFGIFVLGVIVYFLYTSNNEMISEEPLSKTDLIDVREDNAQVNAYVSFIQSGDTAMTFDHTFANEALTELANATGALANDLGFDIKTDLDKVKVLAEKIINDPYAVTHSTDIRKAGDIITASLSSMQKAMFPGLSAEAAEVQRTVAKINPQILTLDQKDDVKAFFRSAADLLQKMN